MDLAEPLRKSDVSENSRVYLGHETNLKKSLSKSLKKFEYQRYF